MATREAVDSGFLCLELWLGFVPNVSCQPKICTPTPSGRIPTRGAAACDRKHWLVVCAFPGPKGVISDPVRSFLQIGVKITPLAD